MPKSNDYSNIQINSNKLRRAIVESFNEGELRTICFELGIDYDDLLPGGRSDKVRELIRQCERTRRLPELVDTVLEARPHIPRHSLLIDSSVGESPYKGLLAFEERDADIFFGRKTLTAELIQRIFTIVEQRNRSNFLALVGASGSGKSSVARAGLMPEIRKQTNWLIHLITPTSHPLEALAISMTRDSESVTATNTLIDDLTDSPRTLHLFVSKKFERERELTGNNNDRLLLVIDQFEEIFTLCSNEAKRRAFVENLVYAADSGVVGSIVIVIALRADFYGHCLQYKTLHELLEQYQKIVPSLSQSELREAIEGPTEKMRLKFEDGLVDRLLQNVGDEPGALPLLSHALHETWKRRQENKLTHSGYQASGEIQGAIAKTADDVYSQFTPDQQTITHNIFLRLTGLGDTRRRASTTELVPSADDASAVADVIKKLADARLITTSRDYVEVAHEVLIREWPKLQDWLNESRESLLLQHRLAEATKLWLELDQSPDVLYRGVRLAQTLEWATQYDDQLNDQERAFLTASKTEYEAEERARKRRELLTWLVAVGSVVLIIVIGLAVFAFIQRNRAFDAEGQALNARATAEISATEAILAKGTAEAAMLETERLNDIIRANQLAAESQVALGIDPQRSLLLALESLRINQEKEIHLPVAEESLRLALANSSGIGLGGHESLINDAAFSPDGRLLVTSSTDGTIRIWHVNNLDSDPEVLQGYQDGIGAVAFSPDGELLAAANFDGTVYVWEVSNLRAAPIIFRDADIRGRILEFSPDGKWLAVLGSENTILLWSLIDQQDTPHILAGHKDYISTIAFSSDGSWLATAGRDESTRLWDMTSSNPDENPIVLTERGSVEFVEFSPDSRWLSTGGSSSIVNLRDMNDPMARPIDVWDDAVVEAAIFSSDSNWLSTLSAFDGRNKVIRIWSTSNLQDEPTTLNGHDGKIERIVISSDNRWLAAAGEEGKVYLWNLSDMLSSPIMLHGHDDYVSHVEFSQDGNWLVTVSRDLTAHLWDVTSPLSVSTTDPIVLANQVGQVTRTIFSSDDRWFSIISNDGNNRLWDISSLQPNPILLPDHKIIDFSRDGQLLASVNQDRNVHLWDLSAGNPFVDPDILEGQQVGGWRGAFSPDGRWLAVTVAAECPNDGVISLWDISNRHANPVLLQGHTACVTALVFSSDGNRLVTASLDNTVRVWDISSPDTGATSTTLNNSYHAIWEWGLTISPDGSQLAIVSHGTVHLWDMSSLDNEPKILGDSETPIGKVAVAFSPDGDWLVATSFDSTAYLWDTDHLEKEPIQLLGHNETVWVATFNPDSSRLATASSDGTIRLWDITDTPIISVALRGHETDARAIAFSSDGHLLATADPFEGGTVLLWRTQVDELVELACKVAGRNLTLSEWQQFPLEGEYRKSCDQWPLEPVE